MGDTPQGQVCANCGEPGTHQRDEWGICLADTAQSQVPDGGYAPIAPGGEKREMYLLTVIRSAARDLRGGKSLDLVACDLEDALTWDVDPSKCDHPFWKPAADPTCRTCGADVSHIDPMGG